MKLIGIIMVVLMVGLVFATIGNIIKDFETEYSEVEVNTSWADKYNYQDDIAQNGTYLQDQLEKMRNEDNYFFKSTIGLWAVAVAFFAAMSMILQSLGISITILTGVATDMGIPAFVLPFAITTLTITIIWGIVAFWRKTPT